jgi:predicted CopG family antitoxin
METAKHRTQISLEDWQYQILLEMSKKEKKSLSQIIREFLSEKFSKQAAKPKEDSVWSIIGIGSGDGSPVAREHDRFLYAKKKKK